MPAFRPANPHCTPLCFKVLSVKTSQLTQATVSPSSSAFQLHNPHHFTHEETNRRRQVPSEPFGSRGPAFCAWPCVLPTFRAWTGPAAHTWEWCTVCARGLRQKRLEPLNNAVHCHPLGKWSFWSRCQSQIHVHVPRIMLVHQRNIRTYCTTCGLKVLIKAYLHYKMETIVMKMKG